MTFPDHGDPLFQQKIASLQEYQYYAVPQVQHVRDADEYDTISQNSCVFEKALYQHLMQHYISNRSPYRGLLLFHGLGVGKTCSSITIAETLLQDHSARMEPRIWVVLPTALQKGYEDQVFNTQKLLDVDFIQNQCMGDLYRKMVFGSQDNDTLRKKIQSVIKSRYQMFTYEGFAKEAERRNFDVSDKVIIVDEAHNLRIQETDKQAATALLNVAKKGTNNRMVLLSATPMYNEPDEIFWLLSVLCANDKRKNVLSRLPSLYSTSGARNQQAFDLLHQLSQEYISYIRGTNPFTFPARLTPYDSGLQVYSSETKWEEAIKDKLLPTSASDFQIESMKTMSKSDTTLRQALNICYPTKGGTKAKVGDKGFLSVFQRENDSDPIHVSYISPQMKQLYPTEDKLGVIAPKLLRICNLIRNSEGIVVIYSQFIWSGVIPMAVTLEHMGFTRYGARGILKNPSIVDDPVRYPGIPFPSYCILSAESVVMGNSKIDDMIKQINHSSNKHGEKIKVIIMSPVAGEGLSLKNIREVHILDPWYHMNRIDQVVGRAFRTCHHTTLPIQERNVSVFLHVATSERVETSDIHTYKIAARKATQTDEVESLIRDSAIDCPLLKNVNYFPKTLFGFDVLIRSSRGVTVPFHFGDKIEDSPKCGNLPLNTDSSSIRKEVYKNLIPTGLQRLRKFLIRESSRIYFTTEEIVNAIAMHPVVAKSVVLEAVNNKHFLAGLNKTLHMHMSGFVVKTVGQPLSALHVKFVKPPDVVLTVDDCDRESIIAAQPISDKLVGKVLIYKVLDSKCWSCFAKKIIAYGSTIPASIKGHVELLYEEGAFVATKELPRHKNPTRAPYIGFIDIFDSSKFSVILYDYEREMFRDATDNEVDVLKKNRVEQKKPDNNDMLYATMEPHKYSKKPNVPMNNDVKIWLTGAAARSRKGVVCESLRKNDTMKFLQDMHVHVEQGNTKEQICFSLAVELLKNKRLFLLPNFKPT